MLVNPVGRVLYYPPKIKKIKKPTTTTGEMLKKIIINKNGQAKITNEVPEKQHYKEQQGRINS